MLYDRGLINLSRHSFLFLFKFIHEILKQIFTKTEGTVKHSDRTLPKEDTSYQLVVVFRPTGHFQVKGRNVIKEDIVSNCPGGKEKKKKKRVWTVESK